jgi:Caspase domain
MKSTWLTLILLAALSHTQAQEPQRDKSIRPIRIAAKRALIIGNGTYLHQDRIPQSLHDADDMAQTLNALGFVTTIRKDLDLAGLNREIRAFVQTIQSNDLALIYYSGHGGMVEGENFVLPVNYDRPALAREVEQRAHRMSYIRKDLEDSGARVRVLIFDACRSGSLSGEKAVGGGGLAPMQGSSEGTIIAYASEDGHPARFDPKDRNSFYTKALLVQLTQSGAHLKEALERTQLRVYEETERTQRPYLYAFLSGPVYLGGSAPPPPAAAQADPCPDAWKMVRDSSNPAALKEFTRNFSECTPEVRLARMRLTTLERPEDPTPVSRVEPPFTKERQEVETWLRAYQKALLENDLFTAEQMSANPGSVEEIVKQKQNLQRLNASVEMRLNDWKVDTVNDTQARVLITLETRMSAPNPSTRRQEYIRTAAKGAMLLYKMPGGWKWGGGEQLGQPEVLEHIQ